MKLLLAGPGTGKTTKVKTIINDQYMESTVQVISFTNATIDSLTDSFNDYNNVNCSTLHSYALRLNHLDNVHILNDEEIYIFKKLEEKLQIDFETLCNLFECITFENMINSCNKFIVNNPIYAEEKIGKLDLLIVDEFQDFNPEEQKLIHIVSRYADETIILGDDDQSIYSFKDAAPDGIIELYNDSATENIPFENICYRCPDSIVDACMNLIQKNKKRVKKIWCKSNKEGKFHIEQTKNQQETNKIILDRIKYIKETDKDSSILILSPVGFAAKPLIPILIANEYEINDCWSKKIDPENLRLIWLLRSIYTEKQILNLIFYSYSAKLFSKPKYTSTILEYLEKDSNSSEFRNFLIKSLNFKNNVDTYFSEPPELNTLQRIYPHLINIIDCIDPLNIVTSLNEIIKRLNPRIDFKKDKINLMSIHKSKGLEADYVFIVGLVSGILPNETYGTDSIEAQRRLLFVGMSRTLKELYIISNTYWEAKYVMTVDKNQFKYAYWVKKPVKYFAGQMSSFINEIRK